MFNTFKNFASKQKNLKDLAIHYASGFTAGYIGHLHSIPQFFVLDGAKKIWLTMREIGRTTETAQVFA